MVAVYCVLGSKFAVGEKMTVLLAVTKVAVPGMTAPPVVTVSENTPAAVTVAGQTPAKAPAGKAWTAPRAADGHPDLSGVWSHNSATPLERPLELAGRALLTDQELTAMKRKAAELFGQDRAQLGLFADTVHLG